MSAAMTSKGNVADIRKKFLSRISSDKNGLGSSGSSSSSNNGISVVRPTGALPSSRQPASRVRERKAVFAADHQHQTQSTRNNSSVHVAALKSALTAGGSALEPAPAGARLPQTGAAVAAAGKAPVLGRGPSSSAAQPLQQPLIIETTGMYCRTGAFPPPPPPPPAAVAAVVVDRGVLHYNSRPTNGAVAVVDYCRVDNQLPWLSRHSPVPTTPTMPCTVPVSPPTTLSQHQQQQQQQLFMPPPAADIMTRSLDSAGLGCRDRRPLDPAAGSGLYLSSRSAGPWWNHDQRLTFNELEEERLSPLSSTSKTSGPALMLSSRDDSYMGPHQHQRRLSDLTTMSSSPYATLRRRPGPRMSSTAGDIIDDSSLGRRLPVDVDTCSVCSSVSIGSAAVATQEDQLVEIRRLRQDLHWTKLQVERLTSSLRNNATAVESFDKTLGKIAEKLEKLNIKQNSNADLKELVQAVQTLRTENLNCLSEINNSSRVVCGSGPACACGPFSNSSHDWRHVSRHNSLRESRTSSACSHSTDTRRQLTGSTVSLYSSLPHQRRNGSGSLQDEQGPVIRRSSFTGWLRDSLGKAFHRSKKSLSSNGSATALDQPLNINGVSPSSSLQSLTSYPAHSVTSMSPVNTQPSPTYCATIGRSKRKSAYKPKHPLPQIAQNVPLQTVSQPPTPAADNDVLPLNHRQPVIRSSSLYDPRTTQTFLDLLLKANGQRQSKEGRKISVSVIVSADILPGEEQNQSTLSAQIIIGACRIQTSTDWDSLDREICRIFQMHLQRIEPASNLDLSTDSILCYAIGEVARHMDSLKPELLPIGYLVGDANSVVIQLKGDGEQCLDQLAFESLIPRSTLDHYMSLLLKQRRLAFCGPSGTGKSFLAFKLAQCLVRRTKTPLAASSIAVFTSDTSSAHQQAMSVLNVTRLSQRADVDSERTRQRPAVVILNDVTLSSLANDVLDVPSMENVYIIATTNEMPAELPLTSGLSQSEPQPATSDPQLLGRYCVVRYTNRLEPVHGFLGRFLKRQLVSVEADGFVPGLELVRVTEWLPKVWQKLNRFLEALSPPGVDITIGPKLFLACPMDVSKSLVWLTDLWNYFIIAYMSEAVRQSRQSTSSVLYSEWQDLSDWLIDSWPWPTGQQRSLNGPQPVPLHLAATDVGFDESLLTNNC